MGSGVHDRGPGWRDLSVAVDMPNLTVWSEWQRHCIATYPIGAFTQCDQFRPV